MQVYASGARKWSRVIQTDCTRHVPPVHRWRTLLQHYAITCSLQREIREERFLLPPHAASLDDLEGFSLVGSWGLATHPTRA
jgi:hypothetical protein